MISTSILKFLRNRKEEELKKVLANDHTVTGDTVQELIKFIKEKIDDRTFFEGVIGCLDRINSRSIEDLDFKRLEKVLRHIGCLSRYEWLSQSKYNKMYEDWESRKYKDDLKNGELLAGEEIINAFMGENKKAIIELKERNDMQVWLSASKEISKKEKEAESIEK